MWRKTDSRNGDRRKNLKKRYRSGQLWLQGPRCFSAVRGSQPREAEHFIHVVHRREPCCFHNLCEYLMQEHGIRGI